MKKIAMIAPCRLPVPATKGGAVEELITRIIKDNEEQKELNIDLFTIADPQKLSCSYKLTNIIEVREEGIKKLFDKALDKYYRTASGRDAKRLLDESILEAFKKRLAEEGADYEAVVVENHMSTCMLIAQYCRDKYEVPVYFHMHNDVDTYRSPGYINKLTACGVQFIAVSEYI
nr:hypothetical protein [Butyrivibrio sp.]